MCVLCKKIDQTLAIGPRQYKYENDGLAGLMTWAAWAVGHADLISAPGSGDLTSGMFQNWILG